jgi:hypothetical protein
MEDRELLDPVSDGFVLDDVDLDYMTDLFHLINNHRFRKVLKDNDMLSLVTQEHNLEKLKKRLSFRLNLYSEEGKFMGDYVVGSFTTPRKVITEVKKKVTKGSKYSNGYLTGLDDNMFKSNNALNEGYLGRMELDVTFVKRR